MKTQFLAYHLQLPCLQHRLSFLRSLTPVLTSEPKKSFMTTNMSTSMFFLYLPLHTVISQPDYYPWVQRRYLSSRLFDRSTDLDGTKPKRKCLISIEYDHEPTFYFQPVYSSSPIRKLACLKTFTTVVGEFVPNRTRQAWRRKLTEHPGHPIPDCGTRMNR